LDDRDVKTFKVGDHVRWNSDWLTLAQSL